MYHDPLEILNLHRKSNYGQNKNIARFLDQQLSALCSSFVHILIIYANLRFSIGSYWNGCYQFFYFFITSKVSFLQYFCIFVIWSNTLVSSCKFTYLIYEKNKSITDQCKNGNRNVNLVLWVNSSLSIFSASYP